MFTETTTLLRGPKPKRPNPRCLRPDSPLLAKEAKPGAATTDEGRSPEGVGGGMSEGGEEARRRAAVAEYRKKLLSCRELEARAKTGNMPPPPLPLPPVSPCVYVPVGLQGWFPCS
jgi:hypothetical protein